MYTTILLVLLLIFQLIPGTYANIKCHDGYAYKHVVVLAKSVAQTDVSILTRERAKESFHSAPAQLHQGLSASDYFINTSELKTFYYAAHTDYRKNIKRAISHYFHGSKYKKLSFVI